HLVALELADEVPAHGRVRTGERVERVRLGHQLLRVVLADVAEAGGARRVRGVDGVPLRGRHQAAPLRVATGARDAVAAARQVGYDIHAIVATRAASRRARQEK